MTNTSEHSMKISPLAGKMAPVELLDNVARLVTAYYCELPDPSIPLQRVAFGTSGHRGSSFDKTFNELHVLAITQAICLYRQQQSITGPLFIGIDTHALSEPAFANALEVLAANGVEVMMAARGEYTPTPVISHAILAYNRGRKSGLADGIVITPSHNPPDNGGFKYNPPNGGAADATTTGWIEKQANQFLETGMQGVKRIPFERACRASSTHQYDFLNNYIADLGNVLDMKLIRHAQLRLGVDPLGGAGVRYWPAIAEHYKLDLTVINHAVDASFRFMTVDWDGKIRMDPSSPYAMQTLIARKDDFDLAFACDTDHDRHGIVSPANGLIPSNHFLSVCIDYLLQHRPEWSANLAIGKTVVSSQMIDRVCVKQQRRLYEVPVGFKWFSPGLADGSLAFAGEESAGATFLRRNGEAWASDKDGITCSLLAAEITAREGKQPGEYYQRLADELGACAADRIQAVATPEQKKKLSKLSPEQVKSTNLAGEPILNVLTRAPANNEAIGGLKVITENGWFAARPSGTENIYKIYAESFKGNEHLQRLLVEAQDIVNQALSAD